MRTAGGSERGSAGARDCRNAVRPSDPASSLSSLIPRPSSLTMRLALIGYTGHWDTYGPVLKDIPELRLTAVATATAEERLSGFDHAPGLASEARRYDSPEELLKAEKPEI